MQQDALIINRAMPHTGKKKRNISRCIYVYGSCNSDAYFTDPNRALFLPKAAHLVFRSVLAELANTS